MERPERLELIFSRTNGAACAATFDEARALLAAVMNGVEDEFSGVAYNPAQLSTDGRLYPPGDAFEQKCSLEGVRLFYARRHNIFIASNGAIRITRRGSPGEEPCVDKPGKDGKRCPDGD